MSWAMVAGAAITVVGGAITSHNSGSKPSVSNQPSMSPEQQAALNQLLATLTGRDNSTIPYSGALSNPMTPGMGLSLSALEQQALNPDRGASDTFSRLMSDTGTDITEAFTKGVEDPMIKDFQNKILPSITQRFSGNAAFGSDRQDAERKATGDLTDSLSAARANMSLQAREAAKNRQIQAATGAEGINRDRMQALMSLFGAEQVPQQLGQDALTRTYQEFIRQQQGRDQNINQILAALGLNTVNTVVNPGQPGFLAGAAPGIGNAFTQWALRNYFPQNQGAGGTTWDPTGGASTTQPGSGELGGP